MVDLGTRHASNRARTSQVCHRVAILATGKTPRFSKVRHIGSSFGAASTTVLPRVRITPSCRRVDPAPAQRPMLSHAFLGGLLLSSDQTVYVCRSIYACKLGIRLRMPLISRMPIRSDVDRDLQKKALKNIQDIAARSIGKSIQFIGIYNFG